MLGEPVGVSRIQPAIDFLGCKMYIPESSVRNTNTVYEEISIPATTQEVPDTGPLVAIESMDEIGRIGFQARRDRIFERRDRELSSLLL